MKTESDTPETDTFWERCGGSDGLWEGRDFCRDMERERNKLRAMLCDALPATWLPTTEMLQKLIDERNTYRKEVCDIYIKRFRKKGLPELIRKIINEP